MGKRTLGVLAAMVLLLAVVAAPGFAVDVEEGVEESPEQTELPSIEEIGTQSERAREFFPEGYEQPSLFPFLIYPLMIVGAVVVVVVLGLYLLWQPRFSEERKGKRRR